MNLRNSENETPKAISAVMGRSSMFDHERLDVYGLELQFVAWATPLMEEISRSGIKTREICDQLDRASLSALLNTAERNGKRQRQVRAKFFDDARGSATECAACLDAAVVKKLVTAARILAGKQLLLRIVSMLCKLVDCFDSGASFREDDIEYRVGGGDLAVNYSRTRTRTRTRRR